MVNWFAIAKDVLLFFGKIMHFEKLLFSRYWVFESLVDIPRSKGRWKQTLKLSHSQRRRRLRSFGIVFLYDLFWFNCQEGFMMIYMLFFYSLFGSSSQGEFRFLFLLQPNQNSWFTRLAGRCFSNCFFWIFWTYSAFWLALPEKTEAMDDPEVREKEYQEMFRQVKCKIDDKVKWKKTRKKWPNENCSIYISYTCINVSNVKMAR